MKLGLIGAGNMASALARGIGEPVLVHDLDEGRAAALARELGGESVASNAELAERSDVVVLCHKPAQLEEVAGQVDGRASAVASILAATPTDRIEAVYPDLPVYRFIPNIPAEVRQGVLCYAPGSLAAAGPEEELLALFGRAGAVIRLDEALIEPAMALMSCGPAFMSLVAESFAEAGAAHGLAAGRRPPHDGRDDGRSGRVARTPRLRPGGPARPCGHPRRGDGARPAAARGRGAAGCVPRGRGRRGGGHPVIPLAITRVDVADYVNTLMYVYLVLIFVRIILTWIPRIPYNPVLSAVAGVRHRRDRPVPEPVPAHPAAGAPGARRHRPQPDRGDLRAHHRGVDRRQPDSRLSTVRPAVLALVTAGVVVALDQVTKSLVKDGIVPGDHVDVFPGLQLSNVRNTGVAFGALEGAGLAVAVLIGLSLALLLVYFYVNRRLPLLWLPVGMLVGGAGAT